MKRILILMIGITVSNFTFANSSDYLVKILSDNAVKKTLNGVDSYEIKFDAVNTSTTWTYTAFITYQKKAISQAAGTEIDVLCSLVAKITTIGGFAGTDESEVSSEESCMQPF